MIEIYEFIDTTKILLFLFDIDNDKCLKLIKILVERYLLLKTQNEKLCDLIKKIIETMYRESANGEEKKITQMFISVFESISLPFYDNQKNQQKNMQMFLTKNKREKELKKLTEGANN